MMFFFDKFSLPLSLLFFVKFDPDLEVIVLEVDLILRESLLETFIAFLLM